MNIRIAAVHGWLHPHNTVDAGRTARDAADGRAAGRQQTHVWARLIHGWWGLSPSSVAARFCIVQQPKGAILTAELDISFDRRIQRREHVITDGRVLRIIVGERVGRDPLNNDR